MNDDLQKRIEDIEFFILKKRKNQKNFPTLIDLCNQRIDQVVTDANTTSE